MASHGAAMPAVKTWNSRFLLSVAQYSDSGHVAVRAVPKINLFLIGFTINDQALMIVFQKVN